MKYHIPFCLLLAFVLLVACGQSTETLPAQSLKPRTATVDLGTVTATEGVRIGITVIPPATWTPTPIKPTKTSAPTWTPLPTHTPEPTGTATPPGMAKLWPANDWPVLHSPDGQWLWALEYGNLENGEAKSPQFYITHIVSLDGLIEWKVQIPLDFFEKLDRHPGMEQGYLPIFWSPNEPYVHLTGKVLCCIDGPIYFSSGFNMARLNLVTGDFSLQVPDWDLHYYQFSDNGRYYLVAKVGKEKLSIFHLKDGETTNINLPKEYSQSGNAAFTADNTRLAVQTCVINEEDDCYRLALLIVDLATKNYREVIPDLAHALFGVSGMVSIETRWMGNNQVRLSEEGYSEGRTTRQWLVDIVTGEVSELK